MIAIHSSEKFKITPGSGGGDNAALPDGAVVELEILGPAKDVGTAIRVNGKTLTALGIGNLPPGVRIPARVSVENGLVYLRVLVPQAELSARATLAELSLPSTSLSLRLVDAMRSLHLRMEPSRMRALLRVAARFHGREGDAADAALMLTEAGVDPDDASVDDLLAMLAGDRGGEHGAGRDHGTGDDRRRDTQGDASIERRRELARRLNVPNGRERQWLIFPFEREIAGIRCSGSVRFLVDRVALTTAETRVFFDDGTRCQRYSLEGANCDFYATPSFLPARTGDFIVYLVKALKPLGIRGVQYQDPGSTTAALARVDLEA